jgi:hypothetical protein
VPEALEGLNLELIFNICRTFKEMKMKTKIITKLITLTCLASFFLTFGCYNTYSIKPTEVPKLNNTYSVRVGSKRTSFYNSISKTTSYSSIPIMAKSTRHLKQPDGKIVKLTGKTPVSIFTKTGKYTFLHPTISSLNSGHLIIKGSNRSKQIFMLDSIQKVEIQKYSNGKSTFLYFLLGAVAMIPFLLMNK